MDPAQLAQQISSACTLALAPGSSQDERNQAYAFLQQVKDAHTDTWQACLGLFLLRNADGGWEYASDARMFGCQVVGERSVGAILGLASIPHTPAHTQPLLANCTTA